jgi:hypothetical protein
MTTEYRASQIGIVYNRLLGAWYVERRPSQSPISGPHTSREAAKQWLRDQGAPVPQDFSVGDRIQLHPATDAWMRGDRFGQIRKITQKFYHVAMDGSGRVLRVPPHDILGY